MLWYTDIMYPLGLEIKTTFLRTKQQSGGSTECSNPNHETDQSESAGLNSVAIP